MQYHKTMVCDRGTNFLSKIVLEMCRIMRTHKLHSTHIQLSPTMRRDSRKAQYCHLKKYKISGMVIAICESHILVIIMHGEYKSGKEIIKSIL